MQTNSEAGAKKLSFAIAIGALGIVGGALLTLALLLGALSMNVHGVGAFLVCQAAWCLAVAALLIRGSI